MALHMAGTPIAAMASVHCAAATENFLVLENHSVDNPWWDDMVTGLPNPIIRDGYIDVPDTPGLGIELNDEVVREHMHESETEYFASTADWDGERSHDRLWS
ncbi:MAG: enolase C-terminal domain-like protein, partial [Candidatus Poribacteria bacterium]